MLGTPPMSIKRSKQRSFGRREAEESGFGSKPGEPEKTWVELVEGKADDVFVPYVMTTKYSRGTLLLHPKFGKGAIVNVEGPRIEVLFEDGGKKLGHAG
jgi:hypothetical protein